MPNLSLYVFHARFKGRDANVKERKSQGQFLSEAACAYLDAHSAEKYSLAEMAKALYVNGSYLIRVFKRHTGMTPLAYHHRARCAKAKELLAHTDMTVSEVGEAAGFTSSSHFSHIFRKTAGCTPSEYRRRCRSGSPGGTEA